MQKTKLGIPVGIMSAIIFFAAILSNYIGIGSYTLMLILVGYVLLSEEDEWLRKSAVKALVLLVAFSAITTILYLISSGASLITNLLAMITHISFSSGIVYQIVSAVVKVLRIVKIVLFAALGILAFNNGSIPIPVIDDLVEKHVK